MAVNVDLNIIPIHSVGGHFSSEVAGFKVISRPRRAARSRQLDQLILFITLSNVDLLPEREYQDLLETLSRTYYKKSGSITGAMREVAKELNQSLQRINSNLTESTNPLTASICQLVSRENQFYLGITGVLHLLVIQEEGVQVVSNPALAGAELGVSSVESVQYFHKTLKADDTFLIMTRIPPRWTADFLSRFRGQGPESIRRRLIPAITVDSETLIIQAKAGVGKLNLLSLSTSAALAGQTLKPVSAASLPGDADDIQAKPATDNVSTSPGGHSTQNEQITPGDPDPKGIVHPETKTAVEDQVPSQDNVRVRVEKSQKPKEQAKPDEPGKQNRFLAVLLFPFKVLISPFVLLLRLVSSFLDKLMPGDSLAVIPNSMMAFFSLIVPVIIVSIGTTVYIRNGVTAQSAIVYEQAIELVTNAEQTTDVLDKRGHWTTLIEHLEKTDLLYVIPDAVALRERAQKEIDQIDRINRVDYQPAIAGGLPPETYITRIVLGDDEMFLLDGNSGEVLHASRSDQGYVLDQAFQCGPGSSVGTGRIIDIAPWPSGYDPQAAILGVDSVGRIIYCDPGNPPVSGELAKPENSELEGLAGISIDKGNLYVLDPVGSAVWIYWSGEADLQPQNYFEEQVPRLEDVVDMIVTNDELYLLHDDGHLTMCQYSWMTVSPTSCIEPVSYLDTRPGRENTELVPDHPFSQLANNPPPDPSLYLLEPGTQSIYHFSLRSPAFQHHYMPLKKLSGGSSTAFAIDSFDRLIFLVNGNDLYYARIP